MKIILSSGLLLIALLLWWQWPPAAYNNLAIMEEEPTVMLGAEDLDPLLVEQQQQQSLDAAVAGANAPALTGKITRRPDFVSPVEWQVLKAVARERPDSDRELTRMVNYLRFSKQLEVWQMPPESMTAQQHQQLGWQLLAAIPDRVSHQDLAAHHAQQLQMMLLEVLVADESERRQHLQREASRIGVTFDIYSNG